MDSDGLPGRARGIVGSGRQGFHRIVASSEGGTQAAELATDMAADAPARKEKQDEAVQLEDEERARDEVARDGNAKAVSEDEAEGNNGDCGKKQDVNSKHHEARRLRSPSPAGKRRRSASPGRKKESAARRRSPSPERRRGSPSPPVRRRCRDRGRRRSPSVEDRRRAQRDRSRSVSTSRSRSRSKSRSRSRSRSGTSRSKSPPSRSARALSPSRRERSRSRSPRDYRRSPRRRDYSYGRRYSPRRSSSRFRGKRRSPTRRRPWSPPANRSNGVGRPGNNLFIAGFNFITTERDLERKFSRYGRVMDVRIVRDRRSGESRGFGFLTLERDEDADAAIKALDQTEWNGRIVLVEKAKTPTRF